MEVLGDIKVKGKKELKGKIPTKAAAVWTTKEDSILQMFKKTQGKLHNSFTITPTTKNKSEISILLYKTVLVNRESFQNCITDSPETMDVVLGFIKENRFSSDQVRYCII